VPAQRCSVVGSTPKFSRSQMRQRLPNLPPQTTSIMRKKILEALSTWWTLMALSRASCETLDLIHQQPFLTATADPPVYPKPLTSKTNSASKTMSPLSATSSTTSSTMTSAPNTMIKFTPPARLATLPRKSSGLSAKPAGFFLATSTKPAL